jgi:hypothetical protein
MIKMRVCKIRLKAGKYLLVKGLAPLRLFIKDKGGGRW